jgi:hypothetical protein
MLLPSVRRSASYRIRGLELVGDGIYQHGHHWEGSGEPLCRNPPATQSLVIQSNRRWHRLGTGIGLRRWRRSRSARSTWATNKSTMLPPLIKSEIDQPSTGTQDDASR